MHKRPTMVRLLMHGIPELRLIVLGVIRRHAETGMCTLVSAVVMAMRWVVSRRNHLRIKETVVVVPR